MDERRVSDQLENHSRLVRVEEKINHLEKLVSDQKTNTTHSIQELKAVLEKFISQQTAIFAQQSDKYVSLEKRVDKLYTLGGIFVFVVTPIITVLSKALLAKFGI